MTPIFGVSRGLMRGDFRLLRKALMAEFGGALFGVLLCVLLGLMLFAGELVGGGCHAQTRPTLIDLFVAALAGFGGVLALIDERVSPVLPGVAIATSAQPADRGPGLSRERRIRRSVGRVPAVLRQRARDPRSRR